MSIFSKTINFPYQYKTIEFGRIANPIISLPVLTKSGWEELDFLVDSGADTTTFPIELVDQLQADINFKKKTRVAGIEDGKIFGYPGKVQIKIDNLELTSRCYFIESSVVPLLGRLDIWDKFSIVFDNIKEEVIFKPIKKQFIGMPNTFGESGKPDELLEKYSMSVKDIKTAIKKVLKRR